MTVSQPNRHEPPSGKLIATAGLLGGLRQAREYARVLAGRSIRVDDAKLREIEMLLTDTLTYVDTIAVHAVEAEAVRGAGRCGPRPASGLPT